jgi:hypothetical protein
MNMMIDTAKAADQTQFVLITPQDMGVSLFSFSDALPIGIVADRGCCSHRVSLGARRSKLSKWEILNVLKASPSPSFRCSALG